MGGVISVQQKILGVDPLVVDTTQEHELGLELDFNDGTRRRYVRAGAAVAQYDALIVDQAEGPFDWQPSAAADVPIVGICPVSGVSDNYFFWAITKGVAYVKVAATIVAGAVLVPIATAGTLDDTAAAAGNALAMAAGIGVIAIVDDTPSAGIAKVLVS